MATASLYERLGGEEKVRAIVVDLLGSSTGGPQVYDGMDMKTAHTGMNCSAAEFAAVLDDLLAALDKHGVGELEKAELLALNYGLKEQILHV
jgi:hemoglobin